MNAIIPSQRGPSGATLRVAGCCLSAALLLSCHKPPPTAEAAAQNTEAKDKPGAGEESAAGGVELKSDEIKKMGIVTTEAKSMMHIPEASGFGIVIAHETIAQAVAELATAVAGERLSRSALARAQKLAGTPGAMPVEFLEAAERQAQVDEAGLLLAQRRLSSALGQNPPWQEQTGSAELAALAGGHTKLVRATFPFGTVGNSIPVALRLARINATAGAKSWESRSVWNAPADSSIPGTSFFALLKSSEVGEGERLLAWAPVGSAESGVQVPAAAAVINGGKYWCYIEEKPGEFVRTELDTSMPTAAGYFVKSGVSAGDKIVISAAGELLARELNPSTTAD
jgi:hypothetical protein